MRVKSGKRWTFIHCCGRDIGFISRVVRNVGWGVRSRDESNFMALFRMIFGSGWRGRLSVVKRI
jgi:hypothetical protein